MLLEYIGIHRYMPVLSFHGRREAETTLVFAKQLANSHTCDDHRKLLFPKLLPEVLYFANAYTHDACATVHRRQLCTRLYMSTVLRQMLLSCIHIDIQTAAHVSRVQSEQAHNNATDVCVHSSVDHHLMR
jgi:hypothetical protein